MEDAEAGLDSVGKSGGVSVRAGEMHHPPLGLTCPGVSCGPLEFSYGVRKYILNTACFHRLKASDFLDLKAVGTIQESRKRAYLGIEAMSSILDKVGIRLDYLGDCISQAFRNI